MNSKANSQFLLTFPFPHRLSLFLGPKLFSDPSFSYKLQFRKQCNNCPSSHHQCFCFRSQLGRPSKRVCCVCLLLINLTKVTLHLQSSSYLSVFFSVFQHTLVNQSDSVVFAYSWPFDQGWPSLPSIYKHSHSWPIWPRKPTAEQNPTPNDFYKRLVDKCYMQSSIMVQYTLKKKNEIFRVANMVRGKC